MTATKLMVAGHSFTLAGSSIIGASKATQVPAAVEFARQWAEVFGIAGVCFGFIFYIINYIRQQKHQKKMFDEVKRSNLRMEEIALRKNDD
jgi:vacuolar-type H+-ATPase subunit I/STV1